MIKRFCSQGLTGLLHRAVAVDQPFFALFDGGQFADTKCYLANTKRTGQE